MRHVAKRLLFLGVFSALSPACEGPAGPSGDQGIPGDTGKSGTSCTIADKGDGTKEITCADGSVVTVADGAKGEPCAVVDNGDGTKTITCPGSDPITVSNGSDGTPCAVVDNGDGTKTISCPGSDPVTISNGSDGTPCTVVDNGNGTKTITCPGSDPVTVSNGTAGSSCTVVDNKDGTKTINCTDGTHVVVGPPIDAYLDPSQNLPGVVLDVTGVSGASNADGTFAPGDHVALTFTLKNSAGASLSLYELDFAAAWIAGPTTNYQHIVPSTRDEEYLDDIIDAAVQNADGSYTYTFTDAIPANYGVPLYDTTKFSDGELTGALAAGTYTVALTLDKHYWVEGTQLEDVGSATKDFLFNHATTVEPREVVTTANCNRCHDKLEYHNTFFRSATMCATCHTAGSEDQGSTDTSDATPVTMDFRVMVHKIHNAAHLPSVLGVSTNADGSRNYAATPTPYVVGDKDFSGVTYPAFPNFSIAMPKDTGYSALAAASKTKEDNIRKGVTSCSDCHGDPDGAGPLAAPAGGDLATAASKAACGSCHDDVDFAKKYVANGQTMNEGYGDDACSFCHGATTGVIAVGDAHKHPLVDATINPEQTVTVTAVGGATGVGGKFAAGDKPTVTFTVQDASAQNVPLYKFDSFSLGVTGPTTNRQVVIPGALTLSPFDFTGRLAASSTTNKGIMSKVIPTATSVSEPLTVSFTSATAFTVAGRISGALGAGSLAASASTNPSGSSITNIILDPAVTAQNVAVTFTSATAFDVTGNGAALGSGSLPASTGALTRFTSTGGLVAFNLTAGTTAFAAGNTIYFTIFKGAVANPVAFAVVAGRTAYSSGDRFYYDYVAPASSYTVNVPMDMPLEFLGDGTGVAGQVLTAANLPVWYGRQTLFERTALVGVATTVAAASPAFTRYIDVAAIDAGLAANDYIVIDHGNALEEYVQVTAINATTKRLTIRPPKYAHAVGVSVQEATLTYRQEGSYYTLDPATGTVTLAAAATVGNAFVMTYRTDGRFGWKRSIGDSIQTVYYTPIDPTLGVDESWGSWAGKSFVDGTYTVGVWGYINRDYAKGGELQVYRGTTKSSRFDILYGASATSVPYSYISSGDNCDTCHNDLSFHGGGRRGGDTCMMCHATPGPAVHYRTLLHELHSEAFPVFPGGAKNCAKCHGTAETWKNPTDRAHPTQQSAPAANWNDTCTSCHTSTAAGAHADVMTSITGAESCAACHGTGKDLAIETVHSAK